jgi:hypothetical protein
MTRRLLRIGWVALAMATMTIATVHAQPIPWGGSGPRRAPGNRSRAGLVNQPLRLHAAS